MNYKAKPALRPCAHLGCSQEGVHKAPKDKEHLREYIWLCLTHVQLHNAKWDYYKGMSTPEITRELDHDMTWRRPRHLFGHSNQSPEHTNRGYSDDFAAEPDDDFGHAPEKPTTELPQKIQFALNRLNLEFPFSETHLKRNYRELVKKYHPDINPDQKDTTEIFREVCTAYQILMQLHTKAHFH